MTLEDHAPCVARTVTPKMDEAELALLVAVERRLADRHSITEIITTLACGRRARGFFRGPRPPDAESLIASRFWGDGDHERAAQLRGLLASADASAVAYPTIGRRDALQVFLRDDAGEFVYVFTLVSQMGLRDMLRLSPVIVEGFSLQVSQAERLTDDAAGAALDAWAQRCLT